MPTSLEQFNWIVDTQYPEIKKYITHQKSKIVTMEDHDGQFVFGSNKDLGVLFDHPSKFPIKKINVKYDEKDSYFTITVELI